MSKRKSKATAKTSKTKAITRASTAKAAVTKSSPAASSVPLIVLGFDDQQKRAALGLSMPSRTS